MQRIQCVMEPTCTIGTLRQHLSFGTRIYVEIRDDSAEQFADIALDIAKARELGNALLQLASDYEEDE